MGDDGRGLAENVGGAFQVLWALLTPFLRSRRERWGATATEHRRAWPGDDLVPRPRWQYLNGIGIAAPPEQVWPWVAQVGQGRGGFYSFERLENLVGCRIRNADRILAEHQSVARGDGIRLARAAPPLTVAVAETGRTLVLLGGDLRGDPAAEDEVKVSWGFFVEAAEGGRSRLLSRYRVTYGRGLAPALLYGPWATGPIAFVMQRKMLRGIRARAERAARPGRRGLRDTLTG